MANAHRPGKYLSSQAKFVCKSREETLGGLVWKSSRDAPVQEVLRIEPKYCSEPWTIDAKNQRYVFGQHQKRESDAGISS